MRSSKNIDFDFVKKELEFLAYNAVEILQEFEPNEGYYVCFSGGKDSQVILDLVRKAGVKYEVHFNFTSIEFPETIKYIKEYYPQVIWDMPEKTMYQMIEEKAFLPSRLNRYCCALLKENNGNNRIKITGVRWQESSKRKLRKKFECDIQNPETKYINLIIDWDSDSVWRYIHTYIHHYNPLYDKGFKRVGCLGCPMSTKRKEHYLNYPNYKKAIINSLQKGLDKKPNKHFGDNAEKMFDWWVSGLSLEKFKILNESKNQQEVIVKLTNKKEERCPKS